MNVRTSFHLDSATNQAIRPINIQNSFLPFTIIGISSVTCHFTAAQKALEKYVEI